MHEKRLRGAGLVQYAWSMIGQSGAVWALYLRIEDTTNPSMASERYNAFRVRAFINFDNKKVDQVRNFVQNSLINLQNEGINRGEINLNL